MWEKLRHDASDAPPCCKLDARVHFIPALIPSILRISIGAAEIHVHIPGRPPKKHKNNFKHSLQKEKKNYTNPH